MWCAKADFQTDLFHAFLGETEELLRLGDSDIEEIIGDRLAVLLFEYLGQVILVYVVLIRQPIQCDFS